VGRHRGGEQLDDLLELRRRGTGERLRASTVKIFLDGVAENFTAGMIEPYLDASGEPTSNRGLTMIEPAELARHVTMLDSHGFQVHFHAIGDRAVRAALDAVGEARHSNGMRDARHHIAHIQVIDPADIARFKKHGVVANAQPYWACLDAQMRELTIPFLGPERTGRQYPFAALRRAGAPLAFGSDWPVSAPDPLLEMEVAITRVLPEERGAQPFLPEERLDLPTALEAFTMGSAFVNRLDRDTGRSRSASWPTSPSSTETSSNLDGRLGEAAAVLTLVEGAVVHAAPGFG
jgi:predicted amidohydrolase YtcJ